MDQVSQFETFGFLWKRSAIDESYFGVFSDISSRNVIPNSELLNVCRNALSQLAPKALPTRATLFAKSDEQSWSLGWHQDRVIAVKEKHDVPSFTNWTRKNEIYHVEPPVPYLETGFFVQVYLDDVSGNDGPTELALGTHKFGKVYRDQKDHIVENAERHLCVASRGDLLICKPLILHRSLPSQTKNSRRILRIDFAERELPEPLRWNRL